MADEGLIAMVTAEGGIRSAAVVELLAAELEGPGVVFCPNPKMPLWSTHPRVFIEVASTGAGKCPYCGTEYRLAPGQAVSHSH